MSEFDGGSYTLYAKNLSDGTREPLYTLEVTMLPGRKKPVLLFTVGGTETSDVIGSFKNEVEAGKFVTFMNLMAK